MNADALKKLEKEVTGGDAERTKVWISTPMTLRDITQHAFNASTSNIAMNAVLSEYRCPDGWDGKTALRMYQMIELPFNDDISHDVYTHIATQRPEGRLTREEHRMIAMRKAYMRAIHDNLQCFVSKGVLRNLAKMASYALALIVAGDDEEQVSLAKASFEIEYNFDEDELKMVKELVDKDTGMPHIKTNLHMFVEYAMRLMTHLSLYENMVLITECDQEEGGMMRPFSKLYKKQFRKRCEQECDCFICMPREAPVAPDLQDDIDQITEASKSVITRRDGGDEDDGHGKEDANQEIDDMMADLGGIEDMTDVSRELTEGFRQLHTEEEKKEMLKDAWRKVLEEEEADGDGDGVDDEYYDEVSDDGSWIEEPVDFEGIEAEDRAEVETEDMDQ